MQGGCTSWLEKVWAPVSLSLGRERNSLCSVTGGPIGDSGGRIVPWLGYSPSWVGLARVAGSFSAASGS